MTYRNLLRSALIGMAFGSTFALLGAVSCVNAQTRDPFRKPVAPKNPRSINNPDKIVVMPAPDIKLRIDEFRAKKRLAMEMGVPAPKPTTMLLLTEMEVTGIFHTPRGYAAMVEATPLTSGSSGSAGSAKLSYVIYPGEKFFDGQLVAIEEGRLVFRQYVRWSNGKVETKVASKNLRQPNAVTDGLQASRTESQPENKPAAPPTAPSN